MDLETAVKNKVANVEQETSFFDIEDAVDREKFDFSYMFKPLSYQPTVGEKVRSGFMYALEDMQDIPEEIEIFGKQLEYGFGKYFGDSEEIVNRKKQNILTAQRNLDFVKSRRYEDLPQDVADSLSFAFGSGLANYGVMLMSGSALGAGAKLAGIGARAAASAGGLAVGAVMEGTEQAQRKIPRTKKGEIDVSKVTPEWALKTGATTLVYTGVSTLLEKFVGFGRQTKVWEKPIKFNKTIVKDSLKALGRGGVGAISEGVTEGLQSLAATGINWADGTITLSQLPKETQQAFKEFIVGTMVGGTVGATVAINQRVNIKQDLRDIVSPIINDEKKTEEIVNELFNSGVENMQQIISTELELSSELKNKHGKVWNSMLASVSKEMKASGAFNNLSEDEFAHAANVQAKHFADQVLAEANFRGTTIDAIIKDTDIVYDKGLRIKRNINVYDALKNPEMIPPETKLKRTSLIQYLRSRGGVQDVGGDLKSRGAIKEAPGLISKKGMGLDDAALSAWEQGYFPEFVERPTINDLLNAIDDELRGKKRYNVEEEATFEDELADLAEGLDRMGIDWRNMQPAEIEQAVEEYPELQRLEKELQFYDEFEYDLATNVTGMTDEELEAYDERLGMQLYQTEEDRDLVVYHSISAENLSRAIDFGGFPVPSLAIVKKDQEFHFDNLPITLVGNREMIDPYYDSNEVYNRDVWTKTFPQVSYKTPSYAKIEKFKEKLKPYYKETSGEGELGSFTYVASRGNPSAALSEFASSSGAMLYYLRNVKKQDVELVQKDVASDILSRAGINEELASKVRGLDEEADREEIGKAYLDFKEKEIKEKFSKVEDKSKREKFIKTLLESVRENKFDKDGKLYFSVADTIVNAANNYYLAKGKTAVDNCDARHQLRELIKDDDNYMEWATDFFEKELVGDKMVEVGKKLKPFTLENVVDAMIIGKTVASQDTPLPTMGKVIASGAKKLESIRDIKEESKKLVSFEKSRENMEEVTTSLYEFLDMFAKGDNFQENMDRKEAVAIALARVVKNKNITKESLISSLRKELPSEKHFSDAIVANGIEVAKKIKELSRYYFEAKPQRAIKLQEFSGAIIPTDAEFDEIAQKVQENGLKVVRSDNQVEALQEFENVLFQKEKGYTRITPDEYIIKLLEGADESTLAHELAHYWLDTMFNYVRSGRASESYMNRWNAIADYLKIDPNQTTLTRPQQEKFASSYEAYLTRGQLPSAPIQSAFDDYDKWLQRVYNDYNQITYAAGKTAKSSKRKKVRLTDTAIKFFQSMTTGTLDAPMLAPKDTGVRVKDLRASMPTDMAAAPATVVDTTRVVNITEGEKGVSAVFKREGMKNADRIVDELGVSYNKINLEEQAIKATEWVRNNLEEARKVVDGAAAPEGIIDTAIFIAYENEMLRIGNNAEYTRALKIHSQVQSQRGQAIAAERIATNNMTTPAYWLEKVINNREQRVAERLFKGDVKKLRNLITDETKKAAKEVLGKSQAEQAEYLNKLAEKLRKEYSIDTFYQTPEEEITKDNAMNVIHNFLEDAFGITVSQEEADTLINKAEQLKKVFENTLDESGNPSVESFRILSEMNRTVESMSPSHIMTVMSSIYGRSAMLASIKSPVLNILSNAENFATEGTIRRFTIGADTSVDRKAIEDYMRYAWEVYKSSGFIVSGMQDIKDEIVTLGETRPTTQGKGRLRKIAQTSENIVFKYLMGAPDSVAKDMNFVDTADLLATKIAKEEGAQDISKRATEIFKDAILINPLTEQGKQVREQAIEQAHTATFTNNSMISEFSLKARQWLNMIGGNKFKLGDVVMPFVKTPANVQMMGLEYGFGSLYTLYKVNEIIKNPRSEVSKRAIKSAYRNGLGLLLATLIASMFEPDDYIPEFDNATQKDRDLAKAKNAPFNSIKIGNKWVSLDYFGILGIPLVGIMNARKGRNLIEGITGYVKSGVAQGMKIPGIKEGLAIWDSLSRTAAYSTTPKKAFEMVSNALLDQVRARTIPAIVNDVAKVMDKYERDTSGSVLDKVQASIPFLRERLPERYTISGKPLETEGLSVLLFGGRVKTAEEGQLVSEIDKLAKKQEQPSISDVTKYGDLRLLSPEKKIKVRKEFFREYSKEARKVINSSGYRAKSAEDRKKALNKVRKSVVAELKEKYAKDIKREKRRR